MKYFFEDENRRKQLYEELESWVGTPYRHHCMMKGKGVDCIHFAVGVLYALNVFDELPPIDYVPEDWALHDTQDLILERVAQYSKTVEMSKKDGYMDGDVFLYRFAQSSSHVSLYCRGQIYHSLTNMKVTRSSVNENMWKSKIMKRFRLLNK